METQIIKIDGLAISKSSVEQVRKEISDKVSNGFVDPIKVMAAIKFYQKVFEGDDKKYNGLAHLIKSYVVDEVRKDPARKEWYGYKVEVKETGTQYDYSNCNDTELIELSELFKEAKKKLEQRQDFLKTIKDHLDVIQDGEAKTIYPPAKSSSTSPYFTLK